MYSSSPPPPGWYDNPVGDGQRFWDGQQWTDQVRIPWPEPGGSPPPGEAGRTILQPTVGSSPAATFPPTVAMPVSMPMERVRRNAPGRGVSGRVWLAVGGVGVLALLGAAMAANRSGGETDAGSASGSTVAVAPLAAAPGTEQGPVPAPQAPAVESTTAAPAPEVTAASTAAPASRTAAPATSPPSTAAPATTTPPTTPPTTAPATTRAPSTASPTTLAPTTLAPATVVTSVPTTQAPVTTAVETTLANAVTPGAFCSPEGATGLSPKGTAMICSSTNADGVPYGEGKSRWRSQ